MRRQIELDSIMNSEYYHLLSDVRSSAPSHKQAEALRVRMQYALATDEFYLEYQPQWNVHGHIRCGAVDTLAASPLWGTVARSVYGRLDELPTWTHAIWLVS